MKVKLVISQRPSVLAKVHLSPPGAWSMPMVVVVNAVAVFPSMITSASGCVAELGAEGKMSFTYRSLMAAIPLHTLSSEGLSGVWLASATAPS